MLICHFHQLPAKLETHSLGGGLVIWNFSVQLILMKWLPFFDFFMVDANIPFPLTLGKPETQTLGGGGVSNLEFFCMISINEMAAIFQFFIMANTDILFQLTLRKLETQTLGGSVIWNFFIDSVFPIPT